jgi:hypothetical protein
MSQSNSAIPAGFVVLKAPEGLRVRRKDDPKNGVLLVLSCDRDVTTGFHSIQIRLGPEGKDAEIVEFLTQITD